MLFFSIANLVIPLGVDQWWEGKIWGRLVLVCVFFTFALAAAYVMRLAWAETTPITTNPEVKSGSRTSPKRSLAVEKG